MRSRLQSRTISTWRWIDMDLPPPNGWWRGRRLAALFAALRVETRWPTRIRAARASPEARRPPASLAAVTVAAVAVAARQRFHRLDRSPRIWIRFSKMLLLYCKPP